jgi:hypothetical protein
VATTNALPEDEQGKDAVYENNFERLHAQAREEIGVFNKMGLADLIEEGRASHGALVSRLNNMFIKHLETTWVPETLRKLYMEKKKVDFEYVVLGMPPAHEPDALPQVRDAIVKAVEEALDRGAPVLLKDYSDSALNSMEQDVRDVIQKAITDAWAFPGMEIRKDLSVHVQLENLDSVCECVPDVRSPLLNLMHGPQYSFDAHIEGLRNLFSKDNQKKLKWPSADANKMLKNPPLLLIERFSSVIDDLIDEVKCNLKSEAEALIRDAVSGCVKRLSDETACVENWCKEFVKGGSGSSGFFVGILSKQRLKELIRELVWNFLRYNAAMLREVRARVRQVVERASLIESCADQRREIISRQHAVDRAIKGMFQLIGAFTLE